MADDVPVLRTSPRSLLELAAIKLAFDIWLEKLAEICERYNDMGEPEKLSEWIFLANIFKKRDDVDEPVKLNKLKLKADILTEVPLAIRKMIESKFEHVSRELFCWFRGSKSIMKHFSQHQAYNRLNLVVFGGNGTAHFKHTIANFLEDDSLDIITRFEMACVYCVEEKIDVFWPLVCDKLNIDDLQFDSESMMYYWICRKRGELDRMMVHARGHLSLENLMIHTCTWTYWSPMWLAIDYFLSSLSPNDRLDRIVAVFESTAYGICSKYLLPYLDASSQRYVLKETHRGVVILAGFVRKTKLSDYAIQVWLYIRDFITGDEFYRDIIHGIILAVINNLNLDLGSTRKNYEFAKTILTEIWSDSPDHLKKYILDRHFFNIVSVMSSYESAFTETLDRNISFLLAMLSDANVSLRKTFWNGNWRNWVLGVQPSQLVKLLQLCLQSDAKDMDKFKVTEMFARYCDALVIEGHHNELNDILNFLYSESDQREMLDIKINLLSRNDRWKQTVFEHADVQQIQKFSEFIDHLLSNRTVAENFKNQLILPESNPEKFYDKLERNCFAQVEMITENLISKEKHSKLKKQLLAKFREKITEGNLFKFEEKDYANFLIWCSGKSDHQEIRKFVESLPIKSIFEVAFSNCLMFEPYIKYGFASFLNKCTAEDLNKFLRWYFQSDSLCENFKRERIQYYEGLKETQVGRIFCVEKKSVMEEMGKLLSSDAEDRILKS